MLKPITLVTVVTRHDVSEFHMCEWLISRQTYRGPIHWIVINTSGSELQCSKGQIVVDEEVDIDIEEVIAIAHERSGTEAVIAISPEEYYGPQYIEFYVDMLRTCDIVKSEGLQILNLNTGGTSREDSSAPFCRIAFKVKNTADVVRVLTHEDLDPESRCKVTCIPPDVRGLHISLVDWQELPVSNPRAAFLSLSNGDFKAADMYLAKLEMLKEEASIEASQESDEPVNLDIEDEEIQ